MKRSRRAWRIFNPRTHQRPFPGSDQITAVYRRVFLAEGIAGFAARLDIVLNEMAGPYALTVAEQAERLLCRERYGYYDPSSSRQRAYLSKAALRTGQMAA